MPLPQSELTKTKRTWRRALQRWREVHHYGIATGSRRGAPPLLACGDIEANLCPCLILSHWPWECPSLLGKSGAAPLAPLTQPLFITRGTADAGYVPSPKRPRITLLKRSDPSFVPPTYRTRTAHGTWGTPTDVWRRRGKPRAVHPWPRNLAHTWGCRDEPRAGEAKGPTPTSPSLPPPCPGE